MAPNQQRDQSSKVTERHVILVAVLASSLVFIDGSALNLALPAMQEDLQASGLSLLVVLNIYAVFLTSLLLLGGSLADCYGRKQVMAIGISVFALASLLCGVAPHVYFLIGARAFQGVGAALIVPGSLAIIADCVPIERRTQAIGVW